MDLVSFQNSLEDHNTTYTTVDAIVQKIQSIPNHQALKLDLELCLYVCKVIENMIGSKSSTSTVDKSTIAVTVFKAIFPDLTDTETAYIQKQIQYFWSNKLITKRGLLIKFGIFAFNILKKKLT